MFCRATSEAHGTRSADVFQEMTTAFPGYPSLFKGVTLGDGRFRVDDLSCRSRLKIAFLFLLSSYRFLLMVSVFAYTALAQHWIQSRSSN